VQGELGDGEAGGQAAGAALDRGPEAVGVDELGGPDRGRVEPVEQPDVDQLAHGVRQRVDAHTGPADAVGLLVERCVDARRVQAQRGDQAADAGPDDRHHHVDPPGARVGRCAGRCVRDCGDRPARAP
jgi:hypothetical protein